MTTPPPPPPDPGAAGALQAALAAEHAAVYGYGVIGARVPDPQRSAAKSALDAHVARRDRLRTFLTAIGAVPVAAAPAYHLTVAVTSVHTAAQAAASLENGLVTAYLGLAGVSDPNLRRYAALAMQEAIVRGYRWQGTTPSAFPGMPADSLLPERAHD